MYSNSEEIFRVRVEVQYGNLELFGLTKRCAPFFRCSGGDKNGAPCAGRDDYATCAFGGGACLYATCTPCRPCNVTSPPLAYVTFSYRTSATGTLVAGKHTLAAEGPYKAILALLVNLRYVAVRYANTLRLRSPTLSPASAGTQPFETAAYVVSQRQTDGTFAQVREGHRRRPLP